MGQARYRDQRHGKLYCSLYTGSFFDDNTVCIIPHDPSHLVALWAYCSSGEYHDDVRVFDKALKVRGGLVKPHFDFSRWQAVATSKYPNGLPEPYSRDAKQWLFHGHPANASHVHRFMLRLRASVVTAGRLRPIPKCFFRTEARAWDRQS